MLFSVSGVETPDLLPPVVAFVVSFFTSMGGVSGAFLLLPFQMSFLGYTDPSVSATNQIFNVVAIPIGVYRYIKEGRMLWPLTWIIIAGTLPGVFLGALIRIKYLPDPENFKFFVGLVLLYIGFKLIKDIFSRKNPGCDKNIKKSDISNHFIKINHNSFKKVVFDYSGVEYQFSPLTVYSICAVVGILSGIYGIGGGAIAAPFFVAVIGLPVHAVAGAALMGTFITSIAGVAFYQLLSEVYKEVSVAPDWFLGLLFGMGGLCCIYLGAYCQKYISSFIIKIILCLSVLFVSVKYIIRF